MSLLIPPSVAGKTVARKTVAGKTVAGKTVEKASGTRPQSALKLKSPRLILRHGQPKDIPAILSYYQTNQAYLAPFEPLKPSSFYTRVHWEKELATRLSASAQGQALKLLLFRRDSPATLIGMLNFGNFIRGVFQSCTVGYSLAEAAQGQGYMTEALQVGIHHIFTEVKLHRVSANYLPHNQRSGRLLKRLGFSIDGYARDYLYIAGEWQDHVLTSLVNPSRTR